MTPHPHADLIERLKQVQTIVDDYGFRASFGASPNGAITDAIAALMSSTVPPPTATPGKATERARHE